jgi:hypothetical protein
MAAPSPGTAVRRALGAARYRLRRDAAKLRALGASAIDDDDNPAVLPHWAANWLSLSMIEPGSWPEVAEAAVVLRRALIGAGAEPFDPRRLTDGPRPGLPAPEPGSPLDLMRNADAMLAVVAIAARDWEAVGFARRMLDAAIEVAEALARRISAGPVGHG